MFREVKLTPQQKTDMEIARVGFMNAAPFFCYYFYAEMKEVPTLDIETACTDGRRIYYNPEYLSSLKPPERVFVLAHEVYHVVARHPQRVKHYRSEDKLRSLPYDHEFFNKCLDYPINGDLVKNDVGMVNPAWCFDPSISPEELGEDLYEKHFKKKPPGQGGSQGQQQGAGMPVAGDGRKGGKPDPKAQARGGNFDDVLPPEVDPVTGKEDIPDEAEFREAVARAAAAAKAMGKMPGSFQRMVDEILEPQVSWREHIRMLVTGKVGARHETWDKLNRRRIAVSVNAISRGDPFVVMPGRKGFGANDVAVVVDTSGSIGQKELDSFFAEIGGIMQDVRPKRIYVIWCDARVAGVDMVSSLDELGHIKANPKGGGGTDFRPPFIWLEENQVRPECLIYLTDGYGPFPDQAPGYPAIWCMITDVDPPWGEVVRIKV
jgi:predicted metal-dependent peptidase